MKNQSNLSNAYDEEFALEADDWNQIAEGTLVR